MNLNYSRTGFQLDQCVQNIRGILYSNRALSNVKRNRSLMMNLSLFETCANTNIVLVLIFFAE